MNILYFSELLWFNATRLEENHGYCLKTLTSPAGYEGGCKPQCQRIKVSGFAQPNHPP